MDNLTKKCERCGIELKPSQYARLKREGESAVRAEDDLVCRNYPTCDKAEKETYSPQLSYKGVIIEESLENKEVLQNVTILSTKVEAVTEDHHTLHLKQWTLHTVEIPEDRGEEIAQKISKVLETSHGHWYADFKNEKFHYIIFRDKVFKVDRSKPEEYKGVTQYGIALGIPDYQLDFSPHIEEWKRD